MRVALIQPLESQIIPLAKLLKGEIMEPLGLMYIAGNLIQAGIDVKIIDRRIDLKNNMYSLERTNEFLKKSLEEFRPDFIGCSVCSVHIKDAETIGEIIKAIPINATYGLGGAEATIHPRHTMNRVPSADILFCGDGEEPLTAYLQGTIPKNIEKCLLIRGENKEVFPYRETKLSNLPHPFRSMNYDKDYLTNDKNILVDYGKSLGTESPKIAEVITSRGCNGRCYFCSVREAIGKRIRFHDIQWVICEIETILESEIGNIYFNDDVFTFNKERIMCLCDKLISSGIHSKLKWIAQSRPDSIDKEMLDIMKSAGCVRIEYGFESGSEKVLIDMGKGIDLHKYYETVEKTHNAGIPFQANIIYGYPTETNESVKETIKFLSDINAQSVLLNVFSAIPGSQTWYKLKEEKKLDTSDINGEWLPAHPCLARKNYTRMNDHEWVNNLHELLMSAPEASSFFFENEDLFRQVSEEVGGLLIYKG